MSVLDRFMLPDSTLVVEEQYPQDEIKLFWVYDYKPIEDSVCRQCLFPMRPEFFHCPFCGNTIQQVTLGEDQGILWRGPEYGDGLFVKISTSEVVVSSAVRKIPLSAKASQISIETAFQNGIVLKSGETFVQEHTRVIKRPDIIKVYDSEAHRGKKDYQKYKNYGDRETELINAYLGGLRNLKTETQHAKDNESSIFAHTNHPNMDNLVKDKTEYEKEIASTESIAEVPTEVDKSYEEMISFLHNRLKSECEANDQLQAQLQQFLDQEQNLLEEKYLLELDRQKIQMQKGKLANLNLNIEKSRQNVEQLVRKYKEVEQKCKEYEQKIEFKNQEVELCKQEIQERALENVIKQGNIGKQKLLIEKQGREIESYRQQDTLYGQELRIFVQETEELKRQIELYKQEIGNYRNKIGEHAHRQQELVREHRIKFKELKKLLDAKGHDIDEQMQTIEEQYQKIAELEHEITFQGRKILIEQQQVEKQKIQIREQAAKIVAQEHIIEEKDKEIDKQLQSLREQALVMDEQREKLKTYKNITEGSQISKEQKMELKSEKRLIENMQQELENQKQIIDKQRQELEAWERASQRRLAEKQEQFRTVRKPQDCIITENESVIKNPEQKLSEAAIVQLSDDNFSYEAIIEPVDKSEAIVSELLKQLTAFKLS